jgi:hypothetical protein
MIVLRVRVWMCRWLGHDWRQQFTTALNTTFYFACYRCGITVSPANPAAFLCLIQHTLGHRACTYWIEKYNEDVRRREVEK